MKFQMGIAIAISVLTGRGLFIELTKVSVAIVHEKTAPTTFIVLDDYAIAISPDEWRASNLGGAPAADICYRGRMEKGSKWGSGTFAIESTRNGQVMGSISAITFEYAKHTRLVINGMERRLVPKMWFDPSLTTYHATPRRRNP
jgi:hypothetical protein